MPFVQAVEMVMLVVKRYLMIKIIQRVNDTRKSSSKIYTIYRHLKIS